MSDSPLVKFVLLLTLGVFTGSTLALWLAFGDGVALAAMSSAWINCF